MNPDVTELYWEQAIAGAGEVAVAGTDVELPPPHDTHSGNKAITDIETKECRGLMLFMQAPKRATISKMGREDIGVRVAHVCRPLVGKICAEFVVRGFSG